MSLSLLNLTMPPPKIDFTNEVQVVKEIFDANDWIKAEFSNRFSADILQFGRNFSLSFAKFSALSALASKDNEQADFASGFVFGVFDDLLVSMKLLVAGNFPASGNCLRQAVEGIAVSLLCAKPGLVWVQQKKVTVKINYCDKLKAEDRLVDSNYSLGQLRMNREELGISFEGLSKLVSLRKHCHQFSHPSLASMAMRMDLRPSDVIGMGGHFDEAKADFYRYQIGERIGLCEILPNLIEGIITLLRERQA